MIRSLLAFAAYSLYFRMVPNSNGRNREMDDTNLAPEEERQLRDTLVNAPKDIKDGFCRCWPAVKKLLEWLRNQSPSAIVKAVVGLLIKIGDGIFKVLDCQQPAPGGATS